jgi:cytochrome b561
MTPGRFGPLRYGAAAQTFHWLTVVLVVAAYLMSPGGSEQRVYSAAADFGRKSHETLGASVFAVTLLRLFWRSIDTTPADPPMKAWMRVSAKVTHVVLYALLIAIPVTAALGAFLEGHPLTLWVLGDIGPLLAPMHDTGRTVVDIHTTLGNVILWVAGLHAIAGLYHHFFLRDRVLVSMLPGR